MRSWTEIGLMFAAAVLSAALFGFFMFASMATSQSAQRHARADAIVALTGGAQRIQAAGTLLQAGQAKRLFITGVNRMVSSEELRRLLGIDRELFECCVDIDVAAQNTRGNASETRKWMQKNGFKSLIVVTSSYHIPRSMSELGYLLPAVDLISHPVVPDRFLATPWWLDREIAQILGIEYLKYLPSASRFALGRVVENTSKDVEVLNAVHKAVAIQ